MYAARFNPLLSVVIIGVSSLCSAQGTVSHLASGAPPTLVGNAIPVGDEPLGIAITLDGTRAYVAINSSGSVSVVEPIRRTRRPSTKSSPRFLSDSSRNGL